MYTASTLRELIGSLSPVLGSLRGGDGSDRPQDPILLSIVAKDRIERIKERKVVGSDREVFGKEREVSGSDRNRKQSDRNCKQRIARVEAKENCAVSTQPANAPANLPTADC